MRSTLRAIRNTTLPQPARKFNYWATASSQYVEIAAQVASTRRPFTASFAINANCIVSSEMMRVCGRLPPCTIERERATRFELASDSIKELLRWFSPISAVCFCCPFQQWLAVPSGPN